MKEITFYIDIYLFVNLLINGLLIYISSKILGLRLKLYRFIVSDIIASILGFIICLPSMGMLLSLAVKFVSSLFISVSAFGSKGLLLILKDTFIFLSVSTSYTAFAMFCSSMMKMRNIIYINNNEVYYDFPVYFLVIVMIVFMLCISISRKICFCVKPSELMYNCVIEYNGKKTSANAFFDTGNSLTDIISGLPVIVLSRNVAELLINDIEGFLNFDIKHDKIKLVPYKTADGRISIMPAFRPDRFYVAGNELDVVVAVCNDGLNGDYNCLLNRNCILRTER